MGKSIFKKTVALIMVLVMSLTCSTFSAFAADGSAMIVAVEGGETRGFNTCEEGWVYALQQSLSKPTTITLLADWIAPDGNFYCEDADGDEYGTNNGYLYINDDHILTIDLNGHTINRNLKEATDDGMVFYLYDYDSKLTIKDSVGNGGITGANNTGDGGAFYMDRGSLFIEGGEITGNKALNGAGIFAASKNNLCIIGGKITGNTANENGGGIYGDDWGPFYFGGDVVIIGNTGNGTANNLYLEDDDVVIRRAAGQQDGAIPDVPFSEDALISISAYAKNNTLITATESYFNWDDYTHFFVDDAAYGIRPAWVDSGDRTHYRRMFIDLKENIKIPKLTSAVKTSAAAEYVHSIEFDAAKQLVTATLYYEHAYTLDKNFMNPGDAFRYGVNVSDWKFEYGGSIFFWSNPNPMKFRLVNSNDGTYGTFTLVTKWVCILCNDYTGDAKCDDCGKDVNLVAIGDTGYATLNDAVANAKSGDTIKFLEDNVLTSPVTIPEGKEITIDFNGKRLRAVESVLAHGAYLIENYGNLTITDSVGTTSAKNIEYYGIKTHGPLTINGGDYKVTQGQNFIYADDAPVVINAGTFDCANGGATVNVEGTSKVTINGGTFSASEADFVRKYIAQGKLVAVNADRTKCKVLNNTYFTYLGAGLKYAGASADSAKIRFGYDFKDDFDLEASNWKWNFGLDKNSLYTTIAGANYDAANVTNLVISNITPIRYSSNIYSQLVFDVTINGDTYTVKDSIRGTNIKYLAESITNNPTESVAVKNYAKQLLAEIE